MIDALTERESTILQLANSELQGGPLLNKLQDLGISETAYLSTLNQLIDTQKAEQAYPGLVHRMRRLRYKGVAGRRRWDNAATGRS